MFRVVDEDVKHHDVIGETAPITFNDLISASDKEKVVTLKLLFNNLDAGTITLSHIFRKAGEPPKPKEPEQPKRNLVNPMSKALAGMVSAAQKAQPLKPVVV